DVAFTQFEAVDGAAVQGVTVAAVRNPFAGRGFGDQVVVPFERVGCEVCEPGQVARGGVAYRERAPVFVLVETGVGSSPPAAILRDASAIVDPSFGIGRGVEVADFQHERAPRGTGNAKVEPLIEVGSIV